MFTGLIEELGIIRSIERRGSGAKLTVTAKRVIEDARIGDSIAVNGVCLTVTGLIGDTFAADVVAETLTRSTLATARLGQRVNLERAMPATGRFGGHIVAGHVDGVGRILAAQTDAGVGLVLSVSPPPDLFAYIVEKGSIAMDGVSLTVMDVTSEQFRISLIPHSAGATTLGQMRPGDNVNVEVDMIAKYVEKLISFPTDKQHHAGLDRATLRQWGY